MEVDGIDTTTYSYDAYGRFSSLTNPFAEVTSVTYDSAGRVSRKDFDSGVYETFGYDERSRPELILVKDSSNVEIDRKEYVWDAASRVTSAKEGGYWSTYEYDAIDQLTEEEKPGLSYLATYTYDANGNRLTRTVNSVTETYAYDAADKLETVTVNSVVTKEFTCDAAGRTTAVETSAGTTSLAYDYVGRLTSVTYPSTSSDLYTFNGIGTRVSASGSNGSRSYLRSGLGVTSPLLSDGVSTYTPGVSQTQTSTTYAHSGLKNDATQSAENETIVATKVYDAFGNEVSTSGSWSGAFGYGGMYGYQSDPSELRLLGYRFYDSSTGRFTTGDPLGDGRNWYNYAMNNPVAAADPTGLNVRPKQKLIGPPAPELTEIQQIANRIIGRAVSVVDEGSYWYRQQFIKNGRMQQVECPFRDPTDTKHDKYHDISTDCGVFVRYIMAMEDWDYPSGDNDNSTKQLNYVLSSPKYITGDVADGGMIRGDIIVKSGHIGFYVGKITTGDETRYIVINAALGRTEPIMEELSERAFRNNFKKWARLVQEQH